MPANFLLQTGQTTSAWADFECSHSPETLLKVTWHVSQAKPSSEAAGFECRPTRSCGADVGDGVAGGVGGAEAGTLSAGPAGIISGTVEVTTGNQRSTP